MIRFVHHLNYTEGVTRSDGDRWYTREHVPRVRALPGIIGYRSWPHVDVGIPYPSAGAPTPHDQFARRSEVCFPDLTTALGALTTHADLWQPAAEGQTGFREFECMLLEEQPQYDLLRDAPPQHYQYMTLPLWWPQGPPEVDLDAPIFIDSYCIAYAENLPVSTGEDWYLGHHTREGKQLPGMRHYRTWRTVRVPDEAGLDLNRWYRLTELGMSPEAYKATMVHDETRIRFTPSPFGRVIGRWMNISIRLDHVEDFLE
jgi:hypothetical protein